FPQLVQTPSFTPAPHHLHISTPITSKHVTHLQNSIKPNLLHRNTPNLHLTQPREQYYPQSTYPLHTLHTPAQKPPRAPDTPHGMFPLTIPLS
ncbi:LysR family transcriptional regulator, partial [Neisseria sicca]|uniref:LysR family transcriptional regulator n=1 Tax=Neisseria sicca TaxID=490 RepID=UPI0034D98628